MYLHGFKRYIDFLQREYHNKRRIHGNITINGLKRGGNNKIMKIICVAYNILTHDILQLHVIKMNGII